MHHHFQSRHLVIALMTLAFFICPRSISADESTSVPEAEYWRVIADLYAAATVENEIPSGHAAGVFTALADELASISAVELPDGAVMSNDHDFLLVELRAEIPHVDVIQRQPGALLGAKKAQTSPIFVPTDVTSLASILARPEFRYVKPEPPRFVRWLQEQIDLVWVWFGRLLPEWTVTIPAWLVQVITVLATVALAGTIAYVLAQIAGEFAAETRPVGDEDSVGVPLTADAALDRAQKLSMGGDYRSALRYLYLSTLLLMEERGHFRYDRSLTNREYLNRVANDPTLSVTLQDVVDVFDRTWYGYQPLDEETYQRYAETVESLKRYRSP